MTQKRVRNKKIDFDQKYPIRHITDLIPSKLQDYTEVSLNTGMEEEEKEELHLKTALINQSSYIPVPQIIQVSNNASKKGRYTHKKSKEYIKYSTDVKNQYKPSEFDYTFMDKYDITENQFINMVDVVKMENEKISIYDIENKRKGLLWSHVQKNILLLHDHGEFNSYACFRKRIIKSVRKSRKVEVNVTEKLRKLWTELVDVENMVQTVRSVFVGEGNVFELNKAIFDEGVALMFNRKIRRKLKHKLINIERRPVEVPFYKKYSFKEIRQDPRKLNEFKFMVNHRKLTSKEIENEVRLLNNI